eukprot:365796-Chlamydomonas_euryale.AAC.11
MLTPNTPRSRRMPRARVPNPTHAPIQAALARMEAIMGECAPQALSNAAWALVTLEAEPPGSWRAAFLRAALPALEYAAPASFAQVWKRGAAWRAAPMG